MLEKNIKKIYNCSRCGICRHWGWNGVEDVCPVYKYTTQYETEYPRGRVKMYRKLSEGEVAPSQKLAEHMLECTLCGRCDELCPSDIPLHEAFREMRTELAQQGFTLPAYKKLEEDIVKNKNPYVKSVKKELKI